MSDVVWIMMKSSQHLLFHEQLSAVIKLVKLNRHFPFKSLPSQVLIQGFYKHRTNLSSSTFYVASAACTPVAYSPAWFLNSPPSAETYHIKLGKPSFRTVTETGKHI